ncbi:MAG: glycosyltransferase family 4 protein [Chitinophagaceae bacterium]
MPWYDQIKKDKYDLVWFNVAGLGDLQDLVYPVQQCKKLGIPYWLILQHGFEDFFLTNQNEIEAVTEVATSAKRFVFISEKNRISLERAIGVKLKNSFQSVNSLRNEIISEAFKISETNLPKDEGVARFFNLGRFAPKDKAQHLLLEAFSNSKWRNRDWQLSFIGVSGFGEFYLKRLSGFYGLEKEKIKILPHTEHVFEEISKNDVLLMPSLSEGTPFAMIESMACGRPALGTPIGGIPELIIQNKTGWLARTTDIIDVSEAMENVWQDRSQWSTFGNNCRKFIVENYNQENTFARLLSKLIDDTN